MTVVRWIVLAGIALCVLACAKRTETAAGNVDIKTNIKGRTSR